MDQRYSYPTYDAHLSTLEGSSTCSDHVSSIASSRSTKSKTTTNTSYSSPTEYKIDEDSRETVRPPRHDYVIEDAKSPAISPAASVHSLASSYDFEVEESLLDSEDSFFEDVEDTHTLEAIATTPRNFASLFPSANRITICHDDSTIDGNMNLRLDTTVDIGNGDRRQMTLFHLRMRDLKTRDFSLRRYCRDSGREVCNSIRKRHHQSNDGQSSLRERFSNVFASLRRNSQSQPISRPSSSWEDYDSEDEEDDMETVRKEGKLSNTTSLEFSNYTHIDVKPRGHRQKNRYTFEYWGLSYTWNRKVRQTGKFTEVSFHLFRDDEDLALAHIVPFALTTAQAKDETRRGGWVPPCSLWIKDQRIIDYLPDVADVIVSTGLMALVDHSIRAAWPSPRRRAFTIPLSPVLLYRSDADFSSPKKLIDEIFNRSDRRSLRSPREF